MLSTILKKVIFPIISVMVLLLLFLPVCTKDGNIDYFLLWILVGMPFGIHRMCVWLIPKNYGISGGIGVLALNCIIGGLIGGLILFIKLIDVVINLFYIIIRKLLLVY